MSRRSPRLLALIFGSLLLVSSVSAQHLELPEHPNHYIVLVDASGSTARSEVKRRLYEETLRETLVSKIFNSGFGPSIPSYDPKYDRLTLLHFGVVVGPAATAYSHLADYDLATDLIHVRFARRPEISPAAFRDAVFPDQLYQYTILSWAKPLALHKLNFQNDREMTARTFLIVIHDGLPNEHSIDSELDMIRLWAANNYDRTNQVVGTIERNYQFTNGRGVQEPALVEEIRDQSNTPQFFVQAYEIVSRADGEWEAQGRALGSFGDFRVRWLDDSGERPRGVLTAELSNEFTEWLKTAEDPELSLSLGQTEHSGVGLELPFTFSDRLTCNPVSLNATLRVALRRSDPILGVRTFNYVAPKSVTAPQPLHCKRFFIVLIVVFGIVALVLLIAAAYYLYNRRFETHVYVEIPGTLAPIPFARKGRMSGAVQMAPQLGLEALNLRLPNRVTQWLFYTGASVMLSSEGTQDPLGWGDLSGPTLLKLPTDQHGIIPAYWRRLPSEPMRITVTFTHGSQRSELNLTYPRAISQPVTRSGVMTNKNIKAWVALDLGSESMAAYFEDVQGRSDMIKLQAHAESLLDLHKQPGLKSDPLMQAGKVSPRMWNRISFKENAQPREPGDDHAILCFIDQPVGTMSAADVVHLDIYEQSLFRYFHSVGNWPHPAGVLPNPKILFQQQVMDILNAINVSANDGGRVNLSPEMLIKHLTVHVVNNFVLNSIELRNYKREEIHLTITVPNVYSLPHAESIKNFVSSKLSNLADVQVLSESDAVAYYALRRTDPTKDSAELVQFKTEWTRELDRTGKLCLVTIDIGKGTTDLSCILVENPPKHRSLREVISRMPTVSDKRRRHSVQAKTGKSSGGNYLTYLFASYYDKCLKEAFRSEVLGLTEPPFGFIAKPSRVTYLHPQTNAVAALETLIDKVKGSMTEECEIDGNSLPESEQQRLLEDVLDELFAVIKEEDKRTDAEKEAFATLKSGLIDKLWLPIQSAKKPDFFERLLGSSKAVEGEGASSSTKSGLEFLKNRINHYVKENVNELFESLAKLVREHQAISSDRAYIDGTAFVVVSGQASQFRPLRAAIKKKCRDIRMGENQILIMKGVESKEACCKGVVNFWRNNMLVVNDEELQGTYGCMDYATGKFTPFDMKKIKMGGSDTLRFDIELTYLILFTPRSKEEIEDNPPQVNDGFTALLSVFSNESEFTIKYDPDGFRLEVNGRELAVGNFGDVASSIYEKVWPEILEPYRE